MTGSKFLRGCEEGANERSLLVKLRRKVYNQPFQWEDQKVHPLTWFMAKYMIMDPQKREEFWEEHMRKVKKRREIHLAQMRQPQNPPVMMMQYPVANYGVEPKGKPIGPDGF
ncbi:uncharacterized protein TRIADDRAFT_64003 [Trichoplax adhaerens]|uniref:Expressed protein n=1 Tax=Trichoplax adhaerens TaxID=10228 RepID=B3RZC3_TRIAD|nr:expressed protein [Trichoplax adhaerens]EDV23818.1 expressed protein [Trichoplax adhaerens]|eukprot:XP_002113344.1 expressed protein [Trichoplax adhaerens]